MWNIVARSVQMFMLPPLRVVAHNTTKVWYLYHTGPILLIIYGNYTGSEHTVQAGKIKRDCQSWWGGEERSGERKE